MCTPARCLHNGTIETVIQFIADFILKGERGFKGGGQALSEIKDEHGKML